MKAGIVTKEVEVLVDELQHITLELTLDEAIDIGQFIHTLKYRKIDKMFSEEELEDIYKLDRTLDAAVKPCLEEFDQDGLRIEG
jgi:hypothetical protein